MSGCIATRELTYGARGSDERKRLVIRVFAPFEVQPGTVDFDIGEGVAGCSWEVDGLPKTVKNTEYGADSLQALQMASDLDSVLRRFRHTYDFYFPSGEPYFQE